MLLFLQLLLLASFSWAFNYMDYANLHDGVVHLHRAKITGRETQSTADGSWKAWEFLGIKYANAGRFQPPLFFDDYEEEGSPKRNIHVKNGPSCYPESGLVNASEMSIREGNYSEDCLYLNVHLPLVHQDHELLKTDLWPILFVIGGENGSTSASTFDANGFAWETDVVVITVGFRTGLFGYLSSDDWNARGNLGLKDIKMALQWVALYGGRFGADASKIVLCEMASGGSIPLLPLLMRDAQVRDLISGLMTIDSGRISAPIHSPTAQLASLAGCVNSTTPIDCLKTTPLTQILNAQQKMNLKWSPTIDEVFFPHSLFADSRWGFKGNFLAILPENSVAISNASFNGSNDGNSSSCHELHNHVKKRLSEAFSYGSSEKLVEKIVKFYHPEKSCDEDSGSLVMKKFDFDFSRRVGTVLQAAEMTNNKRFSEGRNAILLFVEEFDDSEQRRTLAGRLEEKEFRRLIGSFTRNSHSFGKSATPLVLKLDKTSGKWISDEASSQFVALWSAVADDALSK